MYEATPCLGWMVAIATALVGFALLSEFGLGAGGHGKLAATLRLVVGIALLLLAYKEWRARPAPGETAELPHWLAAVENMGPVRAAGLGFGIYAANPKNLTVGIAAGMTFGSADLSIQGASIVCIVYVLVSASTVLMPTVIYFVAEQSVRPWLNEMRHWLTQHNAAVMAVLLLVIGMLMFGRGIAALGPMT